MKEKFKLISFKLLQIDALKFRGRGFLKVRRIEKIFKKFIFGRKKIACPLLKVKKPKYF